MRFAIPEWENGFKLLLFGFLLLFLELALIRWLGANIFFLSYFSNFILLGSFFGIGVGFLLGKKVSFYRWSPILLMCLILFVMIFPVNISFKGHNGIDSLLIIGSFKKSGFPIWVTLPLIFIAVAAVMASIANGMAALFSRFKPLTAYRLDILGSLLGIISFSFLSYLNAAPVMWGIIVCLVFTLIFFKDWLQNFSIDALLQVISLGLFLLLLWGDSLTPNSLWSPYYKISLHEITDPVKSNYTDLWVNGVPHQRIESTARRLATEPFYFFPYQYKKTPENVLIIGAGTGSDVAIALAHGAKNVDAVEIDPLIYQLGRQLHPDQPYDDARVRVIINDGRAFLEQTKKFYDLIIFALTDSITLVSGQSSLRLESYIYTKESLAAAKKHLTSNGIFSMYGYYSWGGQQWLADRYANTIKEVFNINPCVDKIGKNAGLQLALTVGSNLQCPTAWSPRYEKYIAPSTDNHPFLYLKENRIPTLYLVAVFLILMTTFTVFRLIPGSSIAIKDHFDLFLMGMAFLLLETKSIIVFSLLFGNTWLINALVFAGILMLIYLAIETTHRFPHISTKLLYGLLLMSLVINYFLPMHYLLLLPGMLRFVAAILLVFSPVFLANLIFAERFQYAANSTTAFGINIIGAMIGGLLEYLSLMTGYRFLILLIALFYTIAFLVNEKRGKLISFSPR